MPGWRLGGVRQGLHQRGAGEGAVRGPQRDAGPECADITARILELLGYEGYVVNHPQVAKALRFIREHQEDDGSWYGRWGVNYIYGTWQVLRGLWALKMDMQQPWVLKARQWLESVQHEDGGWGERCNTYDDPVSKAKAPVLLPKPPGP